MELPKKIMLNIYLSNIIKNKLIFDFYLAEIAFW